MLLFPQLITGAIAQFPLKKRYTVSTITNLQEDGSRYRVDGQSPVQIGWTLTFGSLTDTEAESLSAFFCSTFGRLLTFVFLDPESNLLAWSEDLSQPIWAKSPLVTVTVSTEDGFTTLLVGSSAASAVSVSQILQCPAAALLCFSVFARSEQAESLTLTIADFTQSFEIGNLWKQYSVTRSGAGDADAISVGIALTGQVYISRLTVSAQPAPSSYAATLETSGVFMQTRFDQDSLSITALDEDRFSCEVRLISGLK